MEIHLQMVYINKLTPEETNLVDASNELVIFFSEYNGHSMPAFFF